GRKRDSWLKNAGLSAGYLRPIRVGSGRNPLISQSTFGDENEHEGNSESTEREHEFKRNGRGRLNRSKEASKKLRDGIEGGMHNDRRYHVKTSHVGTEGHDDAQADQNQNIDPLR